MIRHSLVIPAFNEAKLLPRLLDTLDVARERYRHGAAAIEVIVADNSSTDTTPEIARERGCRVARVEKRCIAAARNGGAAVANGEVLCFLDADSQIHPDTFNAIDEALTRHTVIAGATGVHLERWSLGIALTYCMFMPMVILTGMDTGVVFCRRADFLTIGGYDERREFAEDVAFLWALRRLGRSRGAKLIRLTQVKAITSTRKFDRHGDWHYFTKVIPGALPSLLSPARRSKMAQEYWYPDER